MNIYIYSIWDFTVTTFIMRFFEENMRHVKVARQENVEPPKRNVFGQVVQNVHFAENENQHVVVDK